MLNFFGGSTPERRVERLLEKGERLFQHGREQEGLEKFAEAAQMLPEAAKPSLYLGRAYVKLKEHDTALKHYYKALYFCKAAEEPAILGEIAQLYLALKRYDLVEEKLKKILQLDLPLPLAQAEKIKPAVRKGLAHLYRRTGRISEALEQQTLALEEAPADLPTMRLLAEAHRYLGEHRAARRFLQKACELAQASGQQAELAQLERKLREVVFPDGAEFGVKERLFAEYGSLCLGTAGDNGLEIPMRPALAPVTWQELAVTLRRLAAFRQAFAWPLTCVTAADKYSELLAALVAQFLELPLKPIASVGAQDAALVCQFLFQEARPAQNALKKLRKCTAASITFALAALVDDAPNEYLPDLIGLPVDKAAKISRKNASELFSLSAEETAAPEQLIPTLLDKFCDLPVEDNLTAQAAYYCSLNMPLRPHLEPAHTFPAARPQIPPAQLVAQLVSTHKREVFAALNSVSEQDCQEPSVLPTLQTLYIEKQDSGLRRMIGKCLIKKAEGLTDLIDLFQTPNLDISLKISILETLSRSAQRQISSVMLAALQDQQEDLRSEASRHLAKLDCALELTDLFARLLSDTPAIIVNTLAYLAQCETSPGYAVLPEFLPNLLSHAEPAVVAAALDAIQIHADRRFAPLVNKLLTHADPSIRVQAIRVLGVIGDLEAGYRLLPFLEQKPADVRYAAAESLTKLEHPRVIACLTERLPKETPEMQPKLLALLGELGAPETVPFMLRFAEEHFDQPAIVTAAVNTLARFADPRSLPFVRAAVAQFPTAEIVLPYIALAHRIGEEEELETLLTFLEAPPAIQFRVAAVLYQHGLKRYFQILQDGMRSQKIPVNLVALDVLGEIGDERSVHALLAGFQRQSPRLAHKIAALISQSGKAIDYYAFCRNLPPAEAEMVVQGIQQAIFSSVTLSEIMNALDSFCVLRQFDAIALLQQFCAAASSLVRCGALKCLARYDPAGSRKLIKRGLTDENIDVANTACLLLNQLKAYGFAEGA